MPSYLRGSTAANLLFEEWVKGFDVDAYERAIVWPMIDKLPRPGHVIHIPQLDNLSSYVFTDVASSTGLTFQANTEGVVTATARSRVLPVEIPDTAIAEMAADPTNEWRDALPRSLSSGIDSDVLALAAALATNVVGDPGMNLDFSFIADGHQKLVTSCRQYFEPGSQSKGFMVVAATQDDDLISIDKITNAQIRGDRLNPIVSGWVATAVGIDFYESTNVSTAGGFANNVMAIPRAFGIGFNQKPKLGEGKYQVIYNHLVAWASYAYATKRDKYAVLVKTLGT